MARLDKVFKAAADLNASDVHVAPDEPFIIRRLGRLRKLKSPAQSAEACRQLIFELLDEQQRKKLDAEAQLDFAYEAPGAGRLRGSAMMHQKGMSAVFRLIPPEIPTLESLRMPPVVSSVLDYHQGLILVTGGTGHGKTTTLAAMVDYINTRRAQHILTIEDPIEFIHPFKTGVVNQREVGGSTWSYANALRGALRQDPDVIVVGELRDLDTISMAISAAETGHLVIGTLATSGAPKTIDRIIDSYPPGEQNQVRAMLSESLRAVITQRLVSHTDERQMALALEILIGSTQMANLIRDSKTFQIPSMMQTGKKLGMQLMDESLLALYKADEISGEDALANASNPDKLKMQVKG